VTDTIYALSGGRPPAAIAIVRVSGPAAMQAGAALAGTLPQPREAALRALRDASGALLDRALVLVFPGPRTATGEDLVELHCHGGRAVVAGVEAALAAQGLRRAEAGEFTRRALTNGRIDLAQAEGLADLLEAETAAQRTAALDATEGRISALIGGWMQSLALCSAQVEAMLDFADEGDVDEGDAQRAPVIAAARAVGSAIREALTAPLVERLRDGVRVVIAGPPNAGKSTLLNLLAEQDAAIVSPIAGTTRDRIEAPVMRAGAAYRLIDTAGLTETDDPIEAIGVERARAAGEAAELMLWLGDDPPPRADALWVHARADEPGRESVPPGRHVAVRRDDWGSVAMLWEEVGRRAAAIIGRSDLPSLRQQQRVACEQALDALAGVGGSDLVILGEQLRAAHASLARITGVNATEAMLDALFGRFCIGK
jgi:tRNA modification GTPase